MLEHWKTEPPLQVMVARYLGIEERQQEAEMMETSEAIAVFRSMGFS